MRSKQKSCQGRIRGEDYKVQKQLKCFQVIRNQVISRIYSNDHQLSRLLPTLRENALAPTGQMKPTSNTFTPVPGRAGNY